MADSDPESTAMSTTRSTGGIRRKAKSAMKTVVKKLHLKEFVPMLVIVVYSLAGAGMFIALERQNDVETRAANKLTLEEARDDFAASMKRIQLLSSILPDWDADVYVKEAIATYEGKIGFSFREDTVWTFWNALLFVGTVYTTIGYGNIFCTTPGGQIATVFYAIIGIPLVLTTLNDLGKVLLKVIKLGTDLLARAVKMCQKEWQSKRRKRLKGGMPLSSLAVFSKSGEIVQESMLQIDELIRDEEAAADEVVEDTPQAQPSDNPPVWAAVFVTIAWLFICAGVFCIWEEWTYWKSFYFFFVSLSTIGFGDITPDHPQYMILCFGFVLTGLALVSVCINVIQSSLQSLYWMMLQMMLGEYQKMMTAGGNQMSASLGMMQMWNKNKAAKILMNTLLSKEKKQVVMQKFQEEAKAQGIELPNVFTEMDAESGMPAILTAQSAKEAEQYVEHYFEEHAEESKTQQSALAAVICHDAYTQTVIVVSNADAAVLVQPLRESAELQTEWESQDVGVQITFLQLSRESASQTSLKFGRGPESEMEIQTQSSMFSQVQATSQTDLYQHDNQMSQTALSSYYMEESTAQTEATFSESGVQTDLRTGDMYDSESQTVRSLIAEHSTQAEPQLDDAASQYYWEVDNASTQCTSIPQNSQDCSSQTELDCRDQTVQTDGIRKKMEHHDTMPLPETHLKGASGTESDEQEADLEWNPFDGRHVEKQKSVKKLKKRFERSGTGAALVVPAAPGPSKLQRTGSQRVRHQKDPTDDSDRRGSQ